MVSIERAPARKLQSIATRYRHALAVGRSLHLGERPSFSRPLPSRAEETVEMAGGGERWRDPRTARLEAVLFVSREPLGLRKIAQFASLADATEARTLIRRLNQLYDRGGTAFRVEEVASGFQLMSRRKFAGWLRRVHQTPVETRLSSPALETLAVVAYRQPVLRATIEAIRGVQCGEMLRQLMERDLVKIVGRSDELGRPFLYGTSRRFLQVFGLRHLDDLPRAASLRLAPGEINPTSNLSGASRNDERTTSIDSTEESDVSIAAKSGLLTPDMLEEERRRLLNPLRAADEDDDFEDDDEDEDDDDEDEDDDEEEDTDFEDNDWEEVDDEAEDEEEEEDDEDWDDDEDDDWDDDDDEDEDEDEDWEEEAE